LGSKQRNKHHRANHEERDAPTAPVHGDPLKRMGRARRSLILAVILLAALALRFHRLDLAEFKGDQVANHRLVLQAVSGTVPAVGIMSSRGVENFALFIYMLAVPALINSSVLFLTGVVALCAVAAVYMAYRLGSLCFGKTCGMVAALLFATSPWAVLFSRSIWTQDMLPLFIAALFFFLVKMRLKPKAWHPMVVMALFATVIQLHFSTFALVLIFPFALRWGWKKKLVRGWLAGVVIALLLVTPYLAHDFSQGFKNIRGIFVAASGRGRGIQGDGYSLMELKQSVKLMSTNGFDYVLGYTRYKMQRASWPFRAAPVFLAALTLAGGVILLKDLRRRKSAMVILLWISAVALVMPIYRINPSYYILTFPVQFILAGLAVQWLFENRARRRSEGRSPGAILLAGAIIVVAVVNSVFWVNILDMVEYGGTTQEDFGVPYRYKLETAEHIKRIAGNDTYCFIDRSADHLSGETFVYLAGLSGSGADHVSLEDKPARVFVLALDLPVYRKKRVDMDDFRLLGARKVFVELLKLKNVPDLGEYSAESTYPVAGALTLCVLARKAGPAGRESTHNLKGDIFLK